MMRFSPRSACTIAVLGVLFCACSDDENAPAAPAPAQARYVNADTGDDAGDGSSGSPWATITHAVATAGEGFNIYVAPAVYDIRSGENFPIGLKPNQQLIGDVTNKGMGLTATYIQGEGAHVFGTFTGAIFVGAEGARVAGFAMITESDPDFLAGVVVDGVDMEIDHNTFLVNMYTGVASGNGAAPNIHDNEIMSSPYSLYLDGSGAVHVHDNIMLMTSIGMHSFGTTNAIIEDNSITASFVGIQTAQGTVTIRNNRFELTGGYVFGAIASAGTSTTIRGNWFASGPALYVLDAGAPDAGTQTSAGQNDFSDIVGTVVMHTGSGLVTVVGNTWASYPPQIGTEIIITGTGSVVWE